MENKQANVRVYKRESRRRGRRDLLKADRRAEGQMLAEKVQRCRNGVSPALRLLPDVILSSLPKKKKEKQQRPLSTCARGVTSADRCITLQRQMAPRCVHVQKPPQSSLRVPRGDAAQRTAESSERLWRRNQLFLPPSQFTLCLCSLAACQLSCCWTSERPAAGIDFPARFFLIESSTDGRLN